MKRVLQLSDIAEYVDATVRSDSIDLEQYVTTDSLLQNKEGRCIAANLPPKVATLVAFKKGDTLVANIRPYLKKIWFADCCGGASQDVLVFRAKEGVPQEYLFASLHQNAFFDYVMKAPKGSKMPRGDESHIMRFPLCRIDINDQRKIGKFLSSVDRLIELSRKRIENLERLAKEIYDYWFVQFDFPDQNGHPYKTSGGKMVYNAVLKREIPAGWEVGALTDIAVFTNGLACQRFRPKSGEGALPVLKITEMHGGVTDKTEQVSVNIPSRYKVYDGDVVFSWSASLEVMIWAYGNAGLNQHIFKVTEKNGWPLYYSYFILGDYVATFRKIAESRKTTMGHITSDHLKMSRVPLPADKEIARRFEQLVRPIFGAWIKSSQQIAELSQTREFLLPLLMNGQAKMG